MTDEALVLPRGLGEALDASSPEDLRRTLAAHETSLNALLEDVRDLADAVAGLADQLDNRASRRAAHGTTLWCWRDLAGEAADIAWRDLAEWVEWLRGRYPIAEQLPECWAQHSELVEELTALHAVWNAAYRDPEAHAAAAADFHDRWLPGVLSRVRTWGVHCGVEHRDRPDGVYGC